MEWKHQSNGEWWLNWTDDDGESHGLFLTDYEANLLVQSVLNERGWLALPYGPISVQIGVILEDYVKKHPECKMLESIIKRLKNYGVE